MTKATSVLSGWLFGIEEVSAGVYRARGTDAAGRSVEFTGTLPEDLLARCQREAARLTEIEPLPLGDVHEQG